MKFTRGRLILIAIVVALFAAYTLFGFFGVPRLLRSNATDFVTGNYGRKIDIGEIQFNPFTLVLQVHGLSFPDSEGRPLVGFRELLVDLNVSSVFQLAPSFAAIELTEPFTSVVVRKDGTLNLVDLARPFATAEEKAAEAGRRAAEAVHRAVRREVGPHRLRRSRARHGVQHASRADHVRAARLRHHRRGRQRLCIACGFRQ